jgi:cellobiose phosphorylase
MRLHGADWNDALDMAWEKGESVAFTCAYAGNLKDIADCLKHMEEKTGISKIEMAEEMKCLLAEGTELYESPDRKQKLLDEYTSLCEHNVKGGMILVSTEQIRKNLVEKAEWLMQHIREKEWISAGDDMGWFNGYYDNHGNAVEYSKKDEVRMMLTGQVFAVMSKTAGEEQVKEICRSADKFLFDQKAGGYRLNTDFKEEKFDLGRMFGFAYGEKENGAVFSHMTVMYANALYQRGFIREGHKVLQTLLEAAMNFENSKMYPGLPEYFDNEGRGLYAYLTGAASWYMLTMITEVFGVKGDLGDLVIAPSLLPEQFDEKGSAGLKLEFARKKFEIIMHNPEKKDLRIEQIRRAVCDEKVVLEPEPEYGVRLRKSVIETLDPKKCHRIDVFFQE